MDYTFTEVEHKCTIKQKYFNNKLIWTGSLMFFIEQEQKQYNSDKYMKLLKSWTLLSWISTFCIMNVPYRVGTPSGIFLKNLIIKQISIGTYLLSHRSYPSTHSWILVILFHINELCKLLLPISFYVHDEIENSNNNN